MENAFPLSATVIDGFGSESPVGVAGCPLTRLRSIGGLPNHLIVSELTLCNGRQQQLEADVLLFLGELDARQLYREHAVSSAFEFCVEHLGYSEDVAWKRVGAARLIRRFPKVYELLFSGHIHLTALMLIKPHLTEENHEHWLELACNKSKRQIEKLVASHWPRPDVPSSVRQLPEGRPSHSDANAVSPAASATNALVAEARQVTNPSTTSNNREASAARIAPLSSRTYHVTFTASEQLKEKLDRARALLSHCINPADLSGLVERAIDALLEGEEKRRFGSRRLAIARAAELSGAGHKARQKSSRTSVAPKDPDPVAQERASTSVDITPSSGVTPSSGATGPSPSGIRRRPRVAVKRAVFERDGGQCTYVDPTGRRCAQRHLLEFDHIEAHAVGGEETVDNLRLRCKSHNQLAAENLFGRSRVKSAIKHAQCRGATRVV